MRLFEIIIRFPGQNSMTMQIQANNDYEARMLAEGQYGKSNVVSHRDVTPWGSPMWTNETPNQ
jgi:hypothetical protein